MQPFSLTKWYADCVSSEGEAFAGHAAELSWGPAHVRYTGCLSGYGGGDPPRMRSTLVRATLPRINSNTCTWQDDALGFSGSWISRSRTFQRRLHRSPAGSVNWSCIMPVADADVEDGTGRRIVGAGYVERLNVTVPPWVLPVTSIVWGRFAANGTSMVWLGWDNLEGEQKCSAFLDSVDVKCTSLNDDIVETDCGTIELGRRKLLYDRRLGDSVPDVLAVLEPLVPDTFFELQERKWVTPAVLHLPGKPDLSGWAVHNHITWPSV